MKLLGMRSGKCIRRSDGKELTFAYINKNFSSPPPEDDEINLHFDELGEVYYVYEYAQPLKGHGDPEDGFEIEKVYSGDAFSEIFFEL